MGWLRTSQRYLAEAKAHPNPNPAHIKHYAAAVKRWRARVAELKKEPVSG